MTAALAKDVDSVQKIEIHWQDEHDRALAPLIYDTVVRAREALTRDLGVDWPLPTRIVVVRDLLSLSAMTGLPYKSAQTGTVAVAKWGRVTLLTPRASMHGFPWRDTVAHELTHLAVTRASRDQAPLWLQEGIAKREEVRWRALGPFDDRPSPDAIAQRGFELGLALPIDKMGPSLAMLPSADAAMVAFAEVTSFVHFYVENASPDALSKLLRELKSGKTPDEALSAASGADRRTWDGRWRAYLAARPSEPLPPLFSLAPGAEHAEAGKMRDVRDRMRLAELLLARGQGERAADTGRPSPTAAATAAWMELNRIDANGASSSGFRSGPSNEPGVRWLRARTLETLERRGEGEALLADPRQMLGSYGPWWALRGRWAVLRGDRAEGKTSFFEADAVDPLYPEAACEAADSAPAGPDASKDLCDAARARNEPTFGGD